ncbi:MAG TPA: WD40 repeat domain-containing protein [Pyrinomonadaceae bacterium]|nr:WD40 repeat domain-containing protein [Pyrinomonadaceae bacterium]
MRSNSALVRLALPYATIFALVSTTCFASAQTTETSNQSGPKLTVKEKARLSDYKGPSRFAGRKALITFSPDGRLVAMSGIKGSITVWDAETGALKAKLFGGKDGKEEINGFAFSPDGHFVATRDYVDKTVRLWDVESWQVKATMPGRKRNLETKLKSGMSFEDQFGPVPFSPDGRAVLSEREDDVVTVSDATTGQEQMTLNHDTQDSGAKDLMKSAFLGGSRHFLYLQTGYSPDGRWIFTINGDKSAKIWDATNGRLKSAITNSERIYRAAFTPNGDALLTVEQQGAMKLWDVETGSFRAQVAPKGKFENFMKGFEFSLDGQKIATFFYGDTRLWDVKTGNLLHKLADSQTTDATFSPDGRWLATASNDKRSAGQIWDVESGELKQSLAPTGEKSVSVIFNSAGTILATTNDKGVTLWDADTGELLATLGEARFPVTFSQDGHTVATGGRKDTALLWELHDVR